MIRTCRKKGALEHKGAMATTPTYSSTVKTVFLEILGNVAQPPIKCNQAYHPNRPVAGRKMITTM